MKFVIFVLLVIFSVYTNGQHTQFYELDLLTPPLHYANKLVERLQRGAINLWNYPLMKRRPSKSKGNHEQREYQPHHEDSHLTSESQQPAIRFSYPKNNIRDILFANGPESDMAVSETQQAYSQSNSLSQHQQNILNGVISNIGWGSPIQYGNNNNSPPQSPGNSYGPPQAAGNSYSPPQAPGNSYSPQQSPEKSYGPPQSPGNSYFPPQRQESSYSPPQSPGNSYGPPQAPGNSYSPPQRPENSYGPPQRPENSYGPPQRPENSYGPPQSNNFASGHSDLSTASFGWQSPSTKEGYEPPVCNITTERPVPVDSILSYPTGTTFETPFGRLLRQEELVLDLIPKVPHVIKIGMRDPLPQNYTTVYTERVEVDLSNPPRNNNGRAFDIKTEVRHSGAIPASASSVTRNSNLPPNANSFEITSIVVQTPNNSAPVGGYNNPNGLFSRGLSLRYNKFGNRSIENPIASQIRELNRLFTQIQGVLDKSGNFPQQETFNIGIEAPIIVTQIQRFTVPEPDSSEGAMLDEYFNFGIGAHPFEYGDMELAKEHWEAEVKEPKQLNLNQLGRSVEEISSTFREWVRNHVKRLREAAAVSFNRAEIVANGQYRQHQYYIVPPGQCAKKIDPHIASGATNLGCSGSGTKLDGPPPGCFPPACG